MFDSIRTVHPNQAANDCHPAIACCGGGGSLGSHHSPFLSLPNKNSTNQKTLVCLLDVIHQRNELQHDISNHRRNSEQFSAEYLKKITFIVSSRVPHCVLRSELSHFY